MYEVNIVTSCIIAFYIKLSVCLIFENPSLDVSSCTQTLNFKYNLEDIGTVIFYDIVVRNVR